MYSILIIEDDPSICTNMKLILTMEGFSATIAVDGSDGMAKIREHRPDMILCDILMPEMDGHTLLDILKSDPEYSNIPFIFVTALGDRVDVRRGMSSGADDYLVKPFSADELVAAVTGRLHRLEKIRLHSAKSTFKEERDALSQISERERQVLLMVGYGATSKEIADKLIISVRTVEVHRSNLMKKLDAVNAAQLARWAFIAEQI